MKLPPYSKLHLKLHFSAFAALAAAAIFTAAPALAAEDEREPDHIFVIMMENHATNQILGNWADAPFINTLAYRYGVATNYHGVTHPSLPNYLAAISGDFQGIWDDCKAGALVTCAPEEFVPNIPGDATDPNSAVYTSPSSPLYGKVPPQLTPAQIATSSSIGHMFAGQTIVDQIEAKGLTWKAYMQSLPFAGADVEYWPSLGGTTYKLYAEKHNPFMYFSNIRSSASRMAKIVTLPQLDYDLETGKTPNFVWISPDQCHDMHGVSNGTPLGYPTCSYPSSGLDHGAIRLGDRFLERTVTKIMESSVWYKRSIIVIAWDEDDYGGYPTGCCGSPTGTAGTFGNVLGGALTPAFVIRSQEPDYRRSNHAYNHYSMLGTIQHLWDLPCLANTCGISDSDLMLDLFVH